MWIRVDSIICSLINHEQILINHVMMSAYNEMCSNYIGHHMKSLSVSNIDTGLVTWFGDSASVANIDTGLVTWFGDSASVANIDTGLVT